MNSSTLDLLFGISVAAWLLSALLQLVDVVTGHQVRRAGRAAGTRDRDRLLAWTISVCTIIVVGLVVGVDLSVRLIVDRSEVLWGALALVGLSTVGAITGFLALRILRRPQAGYGVFREEVRSQAGARISKGRLADYRSWLSSIDERQGDLRRRVVGGRWTRIIPVVVAGIALALSISLSVRGVIPVLVVVGVVVAVGISTWLAFWGARISLARNLAIHAVHQKQRAEAVLLLEELDRKAPRKVAGLTERVSRALAILREQQGQQKPDNHAR